ncbi:unnamed protein product [Lymnaea stagnalis]|uniref:Uncharacterized protein n=1 Tax=Lymnaea stagnalis TaxID=6523 RepID=A0AAV2HWB1_LYMST
MLISMYKLRKSESLPVHIVEQHNDVVPFIHRAIASKLLPFHDIAIIHLDSHPDLLLPINLDADTVFKPQELNEALSIENWLLPLTYAKHLNHIVWVKPPWAHQIQASEQSFTIGKCLESGKVRLSCKENYFLTDGLFCPPQELKDSCEVKLTVVEMLPEKWYDTDTSCTSSSAPQAQRRLNDGHQQEESQAVFSTPERWAVLLKDQLLDKPYILDVDLDFFSTANPFKNLLGHEEERALRNLYHYPALQDTSDETVITFTKTREKQINELENIFTELEINLGTKRNHPCKVSVDDLTAMDVIGKSSLDIKQKDDLVLLCNSLLLNPAYREIPFIQLHDFGCTLDDTELPHHISTPPEVHALHSAFKKVLEVLPRPTVVTISRSSTDGYCPVETVDVYQNDVLKLLENLYGSLKISEDYE